MLVANYYWTFVKGVLCFSTSFCFLTNDRFWLIKQDWEFIYCQSSYIRFSFISENGCMEQNCERKKKRQRVSYYAPQRGKHIVAALSVRPFIWCIVPQITLKLLWWHLNKTWYIDRWQWGEGQNPRTIILPCIFTELSPLNLLVLYWMPVWALSLKVHMELKWNLVYRWQWEEVHSTRTIILPCILTELSPLKHLLFIMVACSGHILESTKKDWN